MPEIEIASKLSTISALVKAGKEEALSGFLKSLEDFQRELSDIHHDSLWRFRELENELGSVANGALSSVPTYVIGSLFLDQCKSQLTRDEKESMLYVSGMEKDGYIYLTSVLNFHCSKRSVAGVHGDDESVLKAVMKLHQAGHRLYAW